VCALCSILLQGFVVYSLFLSCFNELFAKKKHNRVKREIMDRVHQEAIEAQCAPLSRPGNDSKQPFKGMLLRTTGVGPDENR
jgi:hypothetical protein